jgi:hypothetical protein
MFHRRGHIMSTIASNATDVTVRLARREDFRQLAELAVLDSAALPQGELVVAETGGRIVAALPLDGGRPIADPFHRTAALVEVLELRARQLRPETRGAHRAGLAERILRGTSQRPVLRTP